jgi:hypothetical protein
LKHTHPRGFVALIVRFGKGALCAPPRETLWYACDGAPATTHKKTRMSRAGRPWASAQCSQRGLRARFGRLRVEPRRGLANPGFSGEPRFGDGCSCCLPAGPVHLNAPLKRRAPQSRAPPKSWCAHLQLGPVTRMSSPLAARMLSFPCRIPPLIVRETCFLVSESTAVHLTASPPAATLNTPVPYTRDRFRGRPRGLRP